jgi:hypothetical protein
MNCKQGDLAIIVGPRGAPDIGKMVVCLKLIRPGQWMPPEVGYGRVTADMWVTDRPVRWWHNDTAHTLLLNAWCDQGLMPIRPDECRVEEEKLEETV